MIQPTMIEAVHTKYQRLCPLMNERMRRQWAACEALALERGGVAAVAKATGLSRTTIWAGMRALQHPQGGTGEPLPAERSRAPGGGRHPLVDTDPTLVQDLEALVEPTTRGDPQSPLRWTCKSTRKLAEELQRRGIAVSYQTVAALLHALGYSLQAPRKTREGASHPDRDAQFEHINQQVRAFQRRGQPVVSVDTKKKELVGDFKNGGREWQPQGSPEQVRTHDFEDKKLGKVIPYGVYDLTHNAGWVSVGIDHDTAHFATETLRRWWQEMGRQVYPEAAGPLGDGGRRREQQQSVAAVEGGGAGAGRSHPPAHLGLPFPSGDQQVEQDRTSDVLPYHGQLAWETPDQPLRHRQLNWEHQNEDRVAYQSRTGYEPL